MKEDSVIERIRQVNQAFENYTVDGKVLKDMEVDGYLHKPIKRSQLLETIKLVLGLSPVRDSTGPRLVPGT